MHRGTSWLGEKLQAVAGTEVRFRRASVGYVDVTATHSLAEHEVIDGDGFPTKIKLHAWVFTASELLVLGEQLTPRSGDRIEVSGEIYEVAPRDGKKLCVEPLDAEGRLIVVHTQKVG